jgi:hypothetical protein
MQAINLFHNANTIENDLLAFKVPDETTFVLKRYIQLKITIALLGGVILGIFCFMLLLTFAVR